MVQRANILLIQFEIINSAQAKGIQVPSPCHLYAALFHLPCSLWAGSGSTPVPRLYHKLPTCSLQNFRRSNLSLPLVWALTAPATLQPPCPVAALHSALCCLSNNCTAHKPTFSLSPALRLKLKFKFHSFHQAALPLWWQKVLPFMPTGPILPNHRQAQHCI